MRQPDQHRLTSQTRGRVAQLRFISLPATEDMRFPVRIRATAVRRTESAGRVGRNDQRIAVLSVMTTVTSA